jgi:four helix bundle protein
VSIGSNIFEGCSRQTNKSLVAYLYHSHGSAGELVFQTRFAQRRRFGDARLAKDVSKRLVTIRRRLARLIRYHEQHDT